MSQPFINITADPNWPAFLKIHSKTFFHNNSLLKFSSFSILGLKFDLMSNCISFSLKNIFIVNPLIIRQIKGNHTCSSLQCSTSLLNKYKFLDKMITHNQFGAQCKMTIPNTFLAMLPGWFSYHLIENRSDNFPIKGLPWTWIKQLITNFQVYTLFNLLTAILETCFHIVNGQHKSEMGKAVKYL